MIIQHHAEDYRGFTFTVDLQTRLDRKHIRKIEDAVEHAATALASEDFYHWCMQFSYRGNEQVGKYLASLFKCKKKKGFYNSEYTNEEVYDLVMSGAEDFDPTIDNEADVNWVIDYNNAGNVIGYTYPGDWRIYTYFSWFRNNDYKALAGHLVHEYCHKVNLEHSWEWHSLRKYSAPYAIGYWVADY